MSEYNLPNGWVSIELGFFMKKGTGSVNPALFTNEEFDLYSIPAYDIRLPEVLSGSQIGSAKKVLQENDVLLSRIVPHIQRSWIVGPYRGRRQIGSGEWIIFDGNGISPSFLRFFLLSYDFHQKFMKTISGVGGSLTRANPNQTAEFKFPLPPLAEQHRIVARIEELFSSLDQGVEALKTAQQQLKVYRQAVLKWAFEGRLTHPDLEEGVLPEGWVEVEIGKFIEVIQAGKSFKCEERPPNNDEYGVLKVSAVSWGTYNENESKTVLDTKFVNKNYIVKKGDFLISRANTLELVGASVIAENASGRVMLSDKTLRILFNQDVNPKYALYFLRSQKGRKQIQEYSTGNQESMRNIGQVGIKSIKITLPLLRIEQDQIVQEIESRLSVCDKIEEDIVQSLERAEALRQSILKQAFEGRLVEQDPDDEPAGVLLERIATARQSKQKAQKPRKSKRSGP